MSITTGLNPSNVHMLHILSQFVMIFVSSVLKTKIMRLSFLLDFIEFGMQYIDDCPEIAEPPWFYILFELVFFWQS